MMLRVILTHGSMNMKQTKYVMMGMVTGDLAVGLISSQTNWPQYLHRNEASRIWIRTGMGTLAKTMRRESISTTRRTTWSDKKQFHWTMNRRMAFAHRGSV